MSATDLLETIPCPLCGRDDAAERHRVRDHLFGRPGEFRVVQCNGCGLVYLNPRPTLEGLAAHYPRAYFCYTPVLSGALPPWLAMSGIVWHLNVRRIRQLERVFGRVPREARVLDVGCGCNAFLYHLHRLRGCDTLGVDTQAEVVEAIRRRLGMSAVLGPLPRAGLSAEAFDGVGMYEYIEHEGSPREVLAEARRVTRPGGWLVLETPNVDSPLARLFGRKWCQLDAPRHLVLYTPRTITMMLEQSGYEVVAIRRLTYQWMLGFSILVALGLRRLGRLGPLEAALGVAATLPFLPVPWFCPEFMRVYARKRD
ncbi:MAG: hypothetical protein AMXMBFR83_25650 [Phycisphaerae bacterium]